MNKIQNEKNIDILGIGNPLLDIVVEVEDSMLERLNYQKGSMNLITQVESRSIVGELEGQRIELLPGGSASNTISGICTLGSRAAYLGVIGDDEYGRMYRDKTEEDGVITRLYLNKDLATGHVLVMITPDGERTMATHLGAALSFNDSHVDGSMVISSRFMHVEAYQLEDPMNRQALFAAFELAKKSGTKVSLDLSDGGLVRRNKELFKKVLKDNIDIIFANEAEACEFSGKNEEAALHELGELCELAIVKLGEKGSLIKYGKEISEIAPFKVEMVNTNGAGDMYAAGILHGLIKGYELQKAGEIASHVAALVVGSRGSRLDRKYLDVINKYKDN